MIESQLDEARTRQRAKFKNIGEPCISIPLEYLTVTMPKDGQHQVFISFKNLIDLVKSATAD